MLTRCREDQVNWKISIAGILETLVVNCSDQQVFTGGAYAIALRYSKACTVSAYHYNIVANILLVTCATHLLAVTVSRHYWQHPYVGVLRVTVTTLVFVVTGIILSNQGSGSRGFPTKVPLDTETYSPMLLPAACFQSGDLLLEGEIELAFKAGSVESFLGGQIHGWTQYLIMFIFYILAVLASLGRTVRRGKEGGARKRLTRWWAAAFPALHWAAPLFKIFFGMYLVIGIALSMWTIAIAAVHVLRLRWWVDRSDWCVLVPSGCRPWLTKPGSRDTATSTPKTTPPPLASSCRSSSCP